MFASSDDGGRFIFERGGLRLWDHGNLKTVADSGNRVSPARATADGSVFVFQAREVQGFNSGFDLQIYRYDVEQEQLGCVSCPPENVFPAGDSSLGPIASGLNPNLRDVTGRQPHLLHDPDRALAERRQRRRRRVRVDPRRTAADQRRSRPTSVDDPRERRRVATTSSSRPKKTWRRSTTTASTTSTTPGSDGGFKQAPALIPCSGVDLCHGAPQEPPAESGRRQQTVRNPADPEIHGGARKCRPRQAQGEDHRADRGDRHRQRQGPAHDAAHQLEARPASSSRFRSSRER